MLKSKEELNKPEDLKTKIDEQMGIMGKNEPVKKEIRGAFTCFVKEADGKIERIEARSFWRLIFALGVVIIEKYTQLLSVGLVIKIVRNPDIK